MRKRYLTLLLISAVLLIFTSSQNAGSSSQQTLIEELVFTGTDYSIQDSAGLALVPDGLTLDSSYNKSIYTSPMIQAPIPFNAVVPQWLVDLPATTSIEFFLRTSSNERAWGDWQEIHPSYDWTLPEDKDIVGEMKVVPASDGTHKYVQYMFTLSRDDERAKPLLRELRLTFIDSTAGPTVEQMIEKQTQLDSNVDAELGATNLDQNAYPKPFVISRAVWCTDPACNYSDGLEYHPVTHLVLHHTVTSTGEDGNSAATVRAIWSFHTFTRKWGDIGYNFLVDTKGAIYEGHIGGDDVVGTHAAGANKGSMGLAMIGTYLTTKPPDPMLESTINMFSWKADQRNIDVFGASDALPDIEWGLPHVMGHRDVYGTTQCPGDEGHKWIPAIRDEVAARIGLESPHIYVGELSDAFIKSNVDWFVPIYQCGHNTHSWYAWSTTNPAESAHWGEWRPDVPQNGRYKIEAHIPYCNTGRSETSGAKYAIQHADGTTAVVRNHNANVGLWLSLGEYNLLAGKKNVIRLTNLTTTDDGLGVWFDALRLLPLEVLPTAVTTAPADGAWLIQRQVMFEWSIENPDKATNTKLQVATDEQFQNLVVTKEWPSAVENFSHTFGRDYGALFWRVILTSESGSEQPSSIARFGIDTEPPISAVKSLVWLEWNKQYLVSWNGNDALGQIESFTIEYRQASGQGTDWQSWLTGISETSALFTPPDPGQVYEFRSRAVDNLGNIEADHETADISTEQAVSLSHATILPIIRNK